MIDEIPLGRAGLPEWATKLPRDGQAMADRPFRDRSAPGSMDSVEVWLGEHHSAGWGIIASPKIFFAVGAIGLPYHQSCMVAERACRSVL
jgi:hypothetical protein